MRDKAAGAASERGQPAPGPVILKPGMETVPRRKARERGSGSSPHTAQTSPERGSAWGPSRAPGRPRESDGSLKGGGGSDQADERRQQRYNNDLSCPGSPRPTHLLCSNVSGKSLCPLLSAEHLCPGGFWHPQARAAPEAEEMWRWRERMERFGEEEARVGCWGGVRSVCCLPEGLGGACQGTWALCPHRETQTVPCPEHAGI